MKPRFVKRPVKLQDPVYNTNGPKIEQPSVRIPKTPSCGTTGGYNTGCRCAACWNAVWTARLARLERRRDDPAFHGTTAAYRCGCRCERCAEAQRTYYRQYQARKRSGTSEVPA